MLRQVETCTPGVTANCSHFAAKVTSESAHAGFLRQLRDLEAKGGIHPDPDVDAYLKASAVKGTRRNPVTQYMIRILGLEVRPGCCASCASSAGSGYQTWHSCDECDGLGRSEETVACVRCPGVPGHAGGQRHGARHQRRPEEARHHRCAHLALMVAHQQQPRSAPDCTNCCLHWTSAPHCITSGLNIQDRWARHDEGYQQ